MAIVLGVPNFRIFTVHYIDTADDLKSRSKIEFVQL